MIPYQIFILLTIINVVVILSGIFINRKNWENATLLFAGFLLSLYIALQCYSGIIIDATTTWSDKSIGLFFTGFGLLSLVYAFGRIVVVIYDVLDNDPDYFEKKMDGFF
jgi:hypothetical protein